MVIDDFEIFESEVQSGVKDLLSANLKKWCDLGFALIVSGPITEIENAWSWITQLGGGYFVFDKSRFLPLPITYFVTPTPSCATHQLNSNWGQQHSSRSSRSTVHQ